MRPPGWEAGSALQVLISPQMGAELAALQDTFSLVSATTWEDAANELLGPLLDLPDLPVVYWPERAREWALVPRHDGSWSDGC